MNLTNQPKENVTVIQEKISYTDFIIFFQKTISDHIMSMAEVPDNIHPIEIPTVALALRITVEIFRVLTQDNEMLTAKTIIDYFNSTELMPLTICQTLDIFEIFTYANIK